jgi:hypothetical protein
MKQQFKRKQEHSRTQAIPSKNKPSWTLVTPPLTLFLVNLKYCLVVIFKIFCLSLLYYLPALIRLCSGKYIVGAQYPTWIQESYKGISHKTIIQYTGKGIRSRLQFWAPLLGLVAAAYVIIREYFRQLKRK